MYTQTPSLYCRRSRLQFDQTSGHSPLRTPPIERNDVRAVIVPSRDLTVPPRRTSPSLPIHPDEFTHHESHGFFLGRGRSQSRLLLLLPLLVSGGGGTGTPSSDPFGRNETLAIAVVVLHRVIPQRMSAGNFSGKPSLAVVLFVVKQRLDRIVLDQGTIATYPTRRQYLVEIFRVEYQRLVLVLVHVRVARGVAGGGVDAGDAARFPSVGIGIVATQGPISHPDARDFGIAMLSDSARKVEVGESGGAVKWGRECCGGRFGGRF
mmetsp:Transcript_37293/g.111703  ORF Transcript_37293/g.111703 Transcript_37293/m.111703 type:complete len:264 (+) Transcript_37293:24-815(+)